MSGRRAQVAQYQGLPVYLKVNGSGELVVSIGSGGGGGGGGDASAANQLLEIAALGDVNTALGTATGQLDQIISLETAVIEQLGDIGGRFVLGQNSPTNPWWIAPVDATGAYLFPTAAVPANSVVLPSMSVIRTVLGAVEPNSGRMNNVDCDSVRRLVTVAYPPGASTTSNSTTWQIQRRAASFSCTVRKIRAFSRAASAKYIVLVDNATTITNGDMPKGACVFKIPAGDSITESWPQGLTFSAGCCIGIADSVDPTITLSGSSEALFAVQLD